MAVVWERPAMSLVGSLAQMPLAEVLQFLGRSQADGKLVLTSVDDGGLVVFRNGRVIYAATRSVRETFGSLLVARRLVDPPTLLAALERQHHDREERRLGAILVDMGALSSETVGDVVRQQVGAVVAELLRWREGFFRFEPVGIGVRGEVEVDASDLLLEEGVDPTSLADGAAPATAAEAADGGATEKAPAPTAELETAGPGGGEELTAAAADESSVTLRSVIAEPTSPWLTAEIAVAVMDSAAKTFRRCLLLARRGNRLVGIGGFGLPEPQGEGENRIRTVSIATDQPSVLAFVLETGEAYRGPLHETPGDADLVAQIGGDPPVEVVALPLLVRGKAVAILYGDNAPQGRAIGRITALELALVEAGQAMTRAMAWGRVGAARS
jgi:Domain of unknown function (DUF4388)